jgi:hypothetical protein
MDAKIRPIGRAILLAWLVGPANRVPLSYRCQFVRCLQHSCP